jgi:outer membrane protein TolC
MNLKITIIAIICLISGVLSAQEMLSPYLETAAKNNPGLKARFSEYMASLEVIPQVGALPDPQLAFGYFILPVETRNGPQRARISLTQMFPWFGTLNAREEVAINKAKAKYESFEDFKSNLFFEVKATYYDLYFIKKGIDITLDNIRILGSFKNLALIKIEAGKASGVDEIRIEMELADLENNLALLKDEWNIAKVKFNNLLNVEDGSDVVIPDSLWSDDLPYSRQDVLNSLRLNNHQILKFDYLLESYRENERLARKTGLPAMSVGIDYIVIGKTDNTMIDQGNSGRDAILFPKIGITIPLYRKKYTAMVNEALYMQDATAGEREEKINSLEVLFERAYYEYIDGQRRISLYLKQKNYAHKAISILETEYATNGRNFEEILRMEKRLLTYSLELEKAYSDKQASIAFINYLIGE